ncbi:GNAT family N-acetyltransferase [Maricaulaceae bacterium NA33B04]|nr:GNAT family N-acetyltransferase [Maricaulaceae bacterium NA33B04]
MTLPQTAPPLTTERLVLRAARAEDFDNTVALWSDERVYRHIGGQPSPPDHSWRRLQQFAGLWVLIGYGYWIAETKAGEFVGQVGVADFKRDCSADIAGVPETGWVLSPDHHGKGYATEAMGAILAWMDTHLDAPRSVCLIAPENAASIRVAEKLGYGKREMAKLGEADTLVMWRARGG